MDVYDFTARDIEGNEVSLDRYRGQTLLIVNTASRCGFTPQYEGLEALYRKYRDRGFAVLAFPCNQFGAQEPGSEAEIREFCSLNYDVSFPMFAKVDVNGEQAHPLWRHLSGGAEGGSGEPIKWNFTKFLVGKDGKVIRRYAPRDTPAELDTAIDAAML